MTFTEMCSACDNHCPKTTNSGGAIGEALERCLVRAITSRRVTVGIQDCAKVLGCAPERVMLCVIPDMAESSDVSLHIQHTLVRSFCWEHDIRLLSVQNSDKLLNLLNSASTINTNTSTPTSTEQENGGELTPPSTTTTPPTTTPTTTTPNSTPTSLPAAVSCLLIEAPAEEEKLSGDEEFVCHYHDTVIFSDVFPKPVVQLPI